METNSRSVIKSPTFETPDGWGASYKLLKDGGPGIVVGPGAADGKIVAQAFLTSPGTQYKAIARGLNPTDAGVARGSLQINWQDREGRFITVSAGRFDVGPTESTYETVVIAPPGAFSGVLYVAPAGTQQAVRYTEMNLIQLDPLVDFRIYQFFGIPGDIALKVALPLLIAVIVFHRQLAGAMRATFGPANEREDAAVTFLGRWFVPAIALVMSCLPFVFLEGIYETNYDAKWHQTVADAVMRWKSLSIDLGGDPLHNFGIQHAINPQLSPSFWIGWLLGGDHRIQVIGAAQSAILFALLFCFCRLSGAKHHDGAAISLIAMLYLCVPNLSNGAITHNATLGLLWQEGAIAATATLLCFSLIGTHLNGARWAIPACGLVVLWIGLAFPELFAFFTLACIGLCGGAMIASQTWREMLVKAVASAGIAAILLVIGLPFLILNLYRNTTQLQLATLRTDDFWYLFSKQASLIQLMPLDRAAPLYLFFAFAVVGGGLALYFGNRFAHRFVFAAIGLQVGVYGLSALNTVVKFAPISFVYVEQMGMPVVAALAGVGAWGLMRAIAHALWAALRIRHSQSAGFAALVLLCLMGILLHRLAAIDRPYQSEWPARTTSAPARIQAEALAIRPGDIFKGRGVMLLGMNARGPINWPTDAFPLLHYNFRHEFGNDLMTDAEGLNIPMINEYGHWVTAQMMTLVATAFYDPNDPIIRAAQVPRRFRANLARLLGVTLAVADGELVNQKLLYKGSADGHPVFLYEIAGANLGQFSPSQTVAAPHASLMLDQLLAPQFDGERLAVVDRPVDGPLVPATDVSVRVLQGPKLRVEARSAERSLLVLPFEFSHCLHYEGSGVERILPVNLAQTGIVIRGHARFDVTYRYGLIAGTHCRALDVQRINDMGLDRAATGRVFK